jgi:hypothetical protein
MRLWPFKRRHTQEHAEMRKDIEDVKKRQHRVELELRTIAVRAQRQGRR